MAPTPKPLRIAIQSIQFECPKTRWSAHKHSNVRSLYRLQKNII